MRWIGAFTIFLCGGYFGFSIVAAHKKEEKTLRQIVSAIDYMRCELSYRLTALPQLLRQASTQVQGICSMVLTELADELENQISPDISCCMESVLQEHRDLPGQSISVFTELGRSLGRFDLQGQLLELDAVETLCKRHLAQLENNRDTRHRSYQTLGLCAGAAIAILLL